MSHDCIYLQLLMLGMVVSVSVANIAVLACHEGCLEMLTGYLCTLFSILCCSSGTCFDSFAWNFYMPLTGRLLYHEAAVAAESS